MPGTSCQEKTGTQSENAGVGLRLQVNPGTITVIFHWALTLCQAPCKGAEHLILTITPLSEVVRLLHPIY